MAAVDPYELLEAVEILSKMPKDFYDKIVSELNHSIYQCKYICDVGVCMTRLLSCLSRKLKSGRRGKKLWKL